MKKILLILSLIFTSLAACSARISVNEKDSEVPDAVAVGRTPGNYIVYKICIDGISYLTYAENIITVQRDEKDAPVKCTQPAKSNVP